MHSFRYFSSKSHWIRTHNRIARWARPAYTISPDRNREMANEFLTMKCQHCEKTATFHITELTGPDGPVVLHLCEDHARTFFSHDGPEHPSQALSNMLTKQLELEKVSEDLAISDNKKCPMCGISFSEFRKGGRLGCSYDYVAFEEDLLPLLLNIHGAETHAGKFPHNTSGSPQRQLRLKQLKDEMQAAIAKEQYEEAGKIRDRIADVERGDSDEESLSMEEEQDPFGDEFQSDPSSDPSTDE
jgi:protein arginine kinase activator